MRHLHYIVAPLLMAAIVGSMPGRLRAESISIEQFKYEFNQLYLQTVEKSNHLPLDFIQSC